jgi:AraC-like DNA-binding protein
MTHAIKIVGGVPDFFSSQVLEARRFYLDMPGRVTRPLAVVCGGCEHCEPNYAISRTDFPFCSIEFVAKGKGSLTIEGRTMPLTSGMIFTYGPGVSHVMTADASDPMTKYFVNLAGRKAESLLREHGLAPGTAMPVASPALVLRLFDDLVVNGVGEGRYRHRVCEVLVELLVLKIAEIGIAKRDSSTDAFVTYQTCRKFIRDHFLRLWTLDEIGESCHVNKAYLCRLFKRFDSQSPYRYLLQLKMSEAAERLQTGDKLVKEVGFDLGFEDPFHFCRAFKSVFGLSPAAIKRLRQPLGAGKKPTEA